MFKRFVRVYTTDLAVSVGEMKQIPKNSVLRYRPKKVVKFHISQAIKAALFDMGGDREIDEDGWDFFATREGFKAHFKKLFNVDVKIAEHMDHYDISSLTFSAYGSAFVHARKVDRAQLRKNPSLAYHYHPGTYSKKLELIESCRGDDGVELFLTIHKLVIDYIAARI